MVNATCGATNGSITLGAVTGGVAPYHIQLMVVHFTGTTSYTNLAAGSHTIDVRDANNCTFATTASVSSTAGPTATLISQTNVLCFGASTGSVVIAPSGGAAPYVITPAQTGLAAGPYTFTVTDANSCTATLDVIIIQPVSTLTAAVTSQVNASDFGSSTGSVVIAPAGGVAPYVITPAQTGLAAGLHTFTVTDANGCTTTIDVTITQPATALTAAVTSQVNVSCFGASTGSVLIAPAGGVAPYVITPAQTGLPAGLHTFTVTDATSCAATINVTITQPAAPLSAAISSQVNVLCFGASTGSVVLAPSGGIAPYVITPAQTGLAAGLHTFTITDAIGCTATIDVNIAQPGSALTASLANKVNVLCFGASTGSVVIAPGGGMAPYVVTPVQTGLPAGNYVFTVTDNNGCTATVNATINEPAEITSVATTIVNATCGASDGSITLGAVTGGLAPYTYSVDGSPFTATLIYPGSLQEHMRWKYRDANNCLFATTASVSNTSGPTAIATTVVNTTCGASNGSITLGAVTDGLAPYTYSVDGSPFTATLLYTGPRCRITCSRGKGCQQLSICNFCNHNRCRRSDCNSYDSCQCSMRCFQRIDNPRRRNRWSCSITLTLLTAVHSLQLSYTPDLAAGTYAVEVRDANNCLFATTASVSNTSGPTAIATTVVNASCGASNGSITLGAVTGGLAPYTYSVDGSAFTATTNYTNLAAGSHAVEVRDANSCLFATTATITNVTGPTAIATTVVNAACGASNGSITLGAVTGGLAPYTYSVDGAGFSPTISYINLATARIHRCQRRK